MRKIFLILMGLLTATTSSAYDFAAANGGKTIYYNITSATTCEVTNNYDYTGSITIPRTVTYQGKTYTVTALGYGAFALSSSLTSVSIPNTVTEILDGAFQDCSNLTSVIIPASVTEIGRSAFNGCSGLTSITIPASVTEIGDSAFGRCSGLTSVIIPNTVTIIDDWTFYDCRALTSVTIPNSVTKIGKSAFYNCNSMTSISIPARVNEIGEEAFSKCSSLTSVTIPAGVTKIGNKTFYFCSNLATVSIPNSVTEIGDDAFNNCYRLTSVTIPVGVTKIGEYAFSYCSRLAAASIPNTVTEIGEGAFYMCTGLTSTIIPSALTKIGNNAFAHCTGLTSIKALNENPSGIILGTTVFDRVDKTNCALIVPLVGLARYTAASQWRDFENIKVTASIIDSETYAGATDCDAVELTYSRTFNNTEWQPLYVPFELDVVNDLGADYEVAEINGVHQFDTDNDGMLDETWIEFRSVTSGTLRANTPYVIRTSETGEHTLNMTDKTLFAAPATDGSVNCSTSRHLYTLTGTYSEISDIEGKYAMRGGLFAQGTPGVHTIKPQRIYLTISERDGGYGTSMGMASMPTRVHVMIDGEMTSVEGISTNMVDDNAPMYNLQGVRVGADYKGVVIQNGKKYIKR